MGDSLDQLAYILSCLEVREQQSYYQNHIPLAICNICSNFHGSNACPLLLDTTFCGETQFVGNFKDNTIKSKIPILRSSLFGHIHSFSKMIHWCLSHNLVWKK
jgi:hypothetical protein